MPSLAGQATVQGALAAGARVRDDRERIKDKLRVFTTEAANLRTSRKGGLVGARCTDRCARAPARRTKLVRRSPPLRVQNTR